MNTGDASVSVGPTREPLVLMGERAAYWPAQSTILVADLHLGKGDALRMGGVSLGASVNRAMLDADLARLARAVARTGARRVLVLGDLIHAPIGLTPEIIEAVGEWRDGLRAEVDLVPGNHDRRIERVAKAWRLRVLDDVVHEPPLVFAHDPVVDATYLCCGHVHPAAPLGGRTGVKLPCFVVGRTRLILPAFGRFTSGGRPEPCPGDRVFAIADDAVIEAGTRPTSRPSRRRGPAATPRARRAP